MGIFDRIFKKRVKVCKGCQQDAGKWFHGNELCSNCYMKAWRKTKTWSRKYHRYV